MFGTLPATVPPLAQRWWGLPCRNGLPEFCTTSAPSTPWRGTVAPIPPVGRTTRFWTTPSCPLWKRAAALRPRPAGSSVDEPKTEASLAVSGHGRCVLRYGRTRTVQADMAVRRTCPSEVAPQAMAPLRSPAFERGDDGSESCMNHNEVANALDAAIARVAEAEYRRLSDGRSDKYVASCVERTMDSFHRLRHGCSPEYDEWDALLYLTWYQPRQITLALALAWPFQKEPQPLHIIDLGCGSWAMAIAIAIAVAQSQLSETDVYIDLHGVDPSDAMRAIGRDLWHEFYSAVRSQPTLFRLRMACEQISKDLCTWRDIEGYCRSDHWHEGGIYPSPTCWLSAIHAVYHSNVIQLRDDFIMIRKKSDPAYEVVTCHRVGYESAQLVSRTDAREMLLRKQHFYLSGYLDRTTAWRRQLAQRLPTSVRVRQLLNRPVPWSTPQDDRCIMWHFSWEST